MKSQNAIRPSMRSWLMALAFVAVLPVLAFALYSVDRLSKHDEESQLRELRRRTQGLQLMLNGQVDAAVTALRTLARSDAAMQGDYRSLHAYAKRVIASNPSYRAITLVDAEGRMAFHTTVPYGTATFPPFRPDLIRQALQTGKPNVSGPFVAPISPRPVVAITVPVTVKGKTDKCLRIIILVDSLRETMMQFPLPKGWIAGIVDKDGVIVARSHQPEKFEGQLASESFRAAMAGNRTGFFPSVTLEGVHMMNTMFALHDGEWVVGLGVPVQTLYQPRYELIREMALLAAVWVVVSFLAATMLASYLVRQTRMAAGDLAMGEGTGRKDVTIRVAEIWKMFHRAQDAERAANKAQRGLHAVEAQRDQVQDLYDLAPCGYHSLDRNGRLVQINNTELNWLGLRREEAIGRPFLEFLTESGKASFHEHFPEFLETGDLRDLEFELVRKDGTSIPVLVSATDIRDEQGKLVASRSTVFDITERKALEKELERLAKTDVLTGLANRREFHERGQREIARSLRFNSPLSLMLLDIDRFKRINDRHGHAAGDLVLKQFSRVCGAVLRETDLPARIGGEEFGVLMPETTLEQAAEVAERLRLALAMEAVAQPGMAPLSFTVSIGVGQLAGGDPTLDALLKRVDEALYKAKNAGRNQVVRSDGLAPLSATTGGG
jgi:diguanylate cyclase (GGDEF)-like protein/PAS domain S-box-containing protein